jgi:hypothetical protein
VTPPRNGTNPPTGKPSTVQIDSFGGRWNVQGLISAAGFIGVIVCAFAGG